MRIVFVSVDMRTYCALEHFGIKIYFVIGSVFVASVMLIIEKIKLKNNQDKFILQLNFIYVSNYSYLHVSHQILCTI